jgi:hypothetical protein
MSVKVSQKNNARLNKISPLNNKASDTLPTKRNGSDTDIYPILPKPQIHD